MSGWLSVPKYAKKHGKSMQHIYRLVKQGRLKTRTIIVERIQIEDEEYKLNKKGRKKL